MAPVGNNNFLTVVLGVVRASIMLLEAERLSVGLYGVR